jgi:type II secretory pathway component HofQ
MVRRRLFRTALVAGLIAVSAAASAAEPVGVKVFVLRYKRVDEATLLVRPLLTDSGSILLQPKINALTVTDRPAALNTIGQALAQFDVPPRGFSIAVKMVRARADASAGDLSKEIGGIGNKLREVFRFNDYALIDSAVLAGAEGESVSYLLGGEYRLTFRIEPAGQGSTLRLSSFGLARERSEAGRRLDTPLFRTSVNVALNQTLVLGASKEEASRRALLLILLVQESPRPGADKGTAGITAAEKKP